MNEATRWRLELARSIGGRYAENPKVEAVIVAGSVGRGWADRYSDIELDVFWAAPPTDEERLDVIRRAGGTLTEMGLIYEEEEWAEAYTVGGVKIEMSQFLSGTMERWLEDALTRADTSEDKQFLIAAVQNSIPLHGGDRVRRWRERAAVFPEALRDKIIREHLEFGYFYYVGEMLAARDDLPFLHFVFFEVEKRILAILLALNGVYRPHPRCKWLDQTAGALEISPPDLSPRLKAVFRVESLTAVRLLDELIRETLMLAERHGPAEAVVMERERIRSAPRATMDAPLPTRLG